MPRLWTSRNVVALAKFEVSGRQGKIETFPRATVPTANVQRISAAPVFQTVRLSGSLLWCAVRAETGILCSFKPCLRPYNSFLLTHFSSFLLTPVTSQHLLSRSILDFEKFVGIYTPLFRQPSCSPCRIKPPWQSVAFHWSYEYPSYGIRRRIVP